MTGFSQATCGILGDGTLVGCWPCKVRGGMVHVDHSRCLGSVSFQCPIEMIFGRWLTIILAKASSGFQFENILSDCFVFVKNQYAASFLKNIFFCYHFYDNILKKDVDYLNLLCY